MSFIEVKSYQYQGLDKKEISVQGIKTRGISQLSLSGNLCSSLRDSRDKIKAVVARFTTWGPVDKILLNLLPSDLSKFSPHLELPMALATLALLWPEILTEDQIERLKSFIYVGSLSLSGELSGAELLSVADGSKLASFKNLDELWAFVLRSEVPFVEKVQQKTYFKVEAPGAKGREYEKFWLEVAAKAKVPVLLLGPPGIGKTHLARWAVGCLEEPEAKQRDEIDRIWTLGGKEEFPLIPFQNPHSRTHLSEFVGVARNEIPRPGVFSLSHGGLLVLDEFPELARDSREILRNILDEKTVIKNTKAGFCTWPADFWLIMTANPCPCGFASGKNLSHCRCAESTRQKYISRFSGPLMDRVGVKLFLEKEAVKIPKNLKLRASPLEKNLDLPYEEGFSSRELFMYSKIWDAFTQKVEVDLVALEFFDNFLQKQRNFSKDWLVHVYE